MRISSPQLLARPPWWSPAAFPLKTAFLLGASVGFLFRSWALPDTLKAPLPPILSLWGVWQFPVVLLFGLMWYKIIYVLVQQKERPSIWRAIGSHIILFCALALLVGGIAPLNLLPEMHRPEAYTLLNPFVVGLTVAFIFEDINKAPGRGARPGEDMSFVPGRATRAGVVAWIGTSTLYLILVFVVHGLVGPIAPDPSCRIICIPDLTVLIINTSPIWIGFGLFLAFLGAIIGGQLCQLSLGRRRRESAIDQ